MGIVIDIIVVLFILLSVFLGYRKGLVALGIHLIAFIVALVVAFVLYRPIGALIINNTSLDENLQGTIETKLEEIINTENIEISQIDLAGETKTEAVSEAAKTLSENIIYGGTIIVLFIILRIALVFVTLIANWVTELPFLKQVNKTGGIIYGLLRGILIVYLVLLLVNLVISLNPQSSMNQAISETYLTKLMMEYNVFNLFF